MPKKEKKSKEKEVKNIEKKKIEKKEKGRKCEWQIVVMVIIMLIVIAGVVFAATKIFNSGKGFMYHGLKFEKAQFDDLLVYKTEFTLIKPEGVYNYNLFLRKDPRASDVPSEVDVLRLRNKAILSYDPKLEKCEEWNLATFELGRLLNDFGLEVEAATIDSVTSFENDIPLVTCDHEEDDTVIIFSEAEETKLYQSSQNEDCFIISVSNCEVVEASEAFQIEIITQMIQRSNLV